MKVRRSRENRPTAMGRTGLTYLKLELTERDCKEIAIIERHARRLNREAEDQVRELGSGDRPRRVSMVVGR